MITIGSWVTRSNEHSLEHKVIGEERGVWITNCGNRIGKSLAVPVAQSRGEIYQCQGCAHGANLMVSQDVESAAL